MLRAVLVACALSHASVSHAERTIALAPLSTLGAEERSAAMVGLLAELEAAIASLPATRRISAAEVAGAIQAARKPHLRSCEADTGCIVELGRLVGATLVVTGQVGGIGDTRIVYLGVTDVSLRKELRSTTLAVTPNGPSGAKGAITRLLDPERYVGTLGLAVDAGDATVYINGSKLSPSSNGELVLPVGTHALRITHPEYRDYVRFVEVEFGKTTAIPVPMTQYPIVRRQVAAQPPRARRDDAARPPAWRRWYVVGPAAVGLAVVSALVMHAIVSDLPDAPCRKLGGEPC